MRIDIHTAEKDYPIYVERGILSRAYEFIDPSRRVFIVSDDQVAPFYLDALRAQFSSAPYYVFPHGEKQKNLHTFEAILKEMLKNQLSRNDVVVALGGGVVSDLAGFCAACYKRGIDYINIPTSMLAQLDSSIGGKTAVDFGGVKNSIGAFHQPSLVLIDPDTLKTLPKRHISNGLAEAVKMGLTGDEKLFELFETDSALTHIDEIIERSLRYKKKIVEEDEKETGIRKILNFGHTYGHAYESLYDLNDYLHGECVAMGMMRVLKNEEIRNRLRNVLKSLDLPYECEADPDEVIRMIQYDKKAGHDTVTMVQVDKIGEGHLEVWGMDELREALKR